jgi:sarcosine oxidase subunit alpha
MVGAGNIGLIVSYQLMQAGVIVSGIIDAAPRIGGYLVHASKIRRMGVPILTGHTVKEAIGKDCLEKAVIWEVDEKYEGIEGTEKTFDVDVLCISVGLSPLVELLEQSGCEIKYIPELSGKVPVVDENHMTTKPFIYAAGDVSGVEEASSAMVEGYLAGLCAAKTAGFKHPQFDYLKEDYHKQIEALRAGPQGERIRRGIAKMKGGLR